MSKINQFALAILLTATVACKKGNNSQAANSLSNSLAAAKIELPNTPETVVRTWEAEVAQNHFDIAKMISAGKTLEAVVSLDSTNAIETLPIISTQILSLTCQETGDKATCDCLMEDAEGQVECKYFLVRAEGQWRIADADSQPVVGKSAPSTTMATKINQKPTK